MSEPRIHEQIEKAAPLMVDDTGRNSAVTADARAFTYAVFSRLMASPFEQNDEQLEFLMSGQVSAALRDVNGALPFEMDLELLATTVDELTAHDLAEVRRLYSSKFEVGNDGPAIPLRAELVRVRESKMKEELVRFYDYFAYKLADHFAWAPDHVSILLEFMQVLGAKEAQADNEDAAQSLARAQLDFLNRHIISWLPVSVGKAVKQAPDDLYTHVLTTLWDFLEKDRAWNASTVVEVEGES